MNIIGQATGRKVINMNLMHDNNWKALHFENGTILRTDKMEYPQAAWEYLVNKIEVEPMEEAGHYRVMREAGHNLGHA